MRKITLEEQRQIQLDILKKVDKYCRENNLRYSLGGGTLLGAVRHKGFIPWDDDIDIMMPRPDYDKFVRGFNGYEKNLTCGAYEVDRNWSYPFAKVYHNRTVMEEPEIVNPVGIFIDVFPLDGFPANEDKRKRYLKYLYFWRMTLYIKSLDYNGKLKRRIHKSILNLVPNSILQMPVQYLLRKYSFTNSLYVGAVRGIYGDKECYPHSVFDNYIDLPFEGYYFSAIRDYDGYLTKHYGKYMELPPLASRVSHHSKAVYLL